MYVILMGKVNVLQYYVPGNHLVRVAMYYWMHCCATILMPCLVIRSFCSLTQSLSTMHHRVTVILLPIHNGRFFNSVSDWDDSWLCQMNLFDFDSPKFLIHTTICTYSSRVFMQPSYKIGKPLFHSFRSLNAS